MNNDTENLSIDSELLHSARVQVPDSDQLQQKILMATKGLLQEQAIPHPRSDNDFRLGTWLSRHRIAAALCACLVLGLVAWLPINLPDTSNPLVSQTNSSLAAKPVPIESQKAINANEASLSIEELEFYEVLLIQDELILAQF